jgi:hypothetical protein
MKLTRLQHGLLQQQRRLLLLLPCTAGSAVGPHQPQQSPPAHALLMATDACRGVHPLQLLLPPPQWQQCQQQMQQQQRRLLQQQGSRGLGQQQQLQQQQLGRVLVAPMTHWKQRLQLQQQGTTWGSGLRLISSSRTARSQPQLAWQQQQGHW